MLWSIGHSQEVVRLPASRPFVASGNEFFWFCLSVRSSGIAASTRLAIKDWWLAQDLDNAVTHRLLEFDNESRISQIKVTAKLIAYEVARTFNGESGGDDDDGDTYADAETEVW